MPAKTPWREFAAALFVACSTCVAGQSESYNFNSLDPPFADRSFAFDISDSAAIVGTFDDGRNDAEGFAWQFPPGFSTVADPQGNVSLSGINSSGYAVGNIVSDNHKYRGLVRAPDGNITYLDFPIENEGLDFTAIDDAGRIFGTYWAWGVSTVPTFHAFVWESGAEPRVLDIPGMPREYAINDANNAGWVVGTLESDQFHTSGFLYNIHDGTLEKIDYPGASRTSFSGMNDRGQIVGLAAGGGVSATSFIRNRDGSYEVLDFPEVAGFSVYGINNHGDLVGNYIQREGRPRRAFVAWSVPEPATALLACVAIPLLYVWRRRGNHRSTRFATQGPRSDRD